jgi:integrase
MQDMARKYEHVVRQKTRHGKIVWYFRRGHEKRIRLPDEYGSEEFEAVYEAALYNQPIPEKTTSRAKYGTLRWLVDQYRDSAEWNEFRPTTKSTKNAILNRILKTAGDSPINSITADTIREGRDRRAKTPDAANRFIKTLSPLFKFAVERQFLSANPCASVAKLKVRNTGGFKTWTAEDVKAFEDRHPIGTKARLAFDLLRYTGLRRSDMVLLGRQHVKNGIIQMRTQKTDTALGLVIIPVLQRTIAATKDVGDLTYLVTEYGRPFTAAGFGNWFRARCNEAGVSGAAHGIRKFAANTLIEADVSTAELMAIFGWKSLKQADDYIREVNRLKLAAAAMNKLDTNNPSPIDMVRDFGKINE